MVGELWASPCWDVASFGEHESQVCGLAGLDKVVAPVDMCVYWVWTWVGLS